MTDHGLLLMVSTDKGGQAMTAGVILRALPSVSPRETWAKRQDAARGNPFDARDWATYERFRKLVDRMQVFILGPAAEWSRLIQWFPTQVRAVACPGARWADQGLAVAAQNVARAVRRAPVDFLAIGMSDTLDDTVSLASAIATHLERPLILAVAALERDASRLRVTQWEDSGYAIGTVTAPALLAVRCPSMPDGWSHLVTTDDGTRVIHVEPGHADRWWEQFLDAITQKAFPSLSPLAALYHTVGQPIWVWGETWGTPPRFTLLSRQLVAEARRLVRQQEVTLVVGGSRLPMAGLEEGFLDGADNVMFLPPGIPLLQQVDLLRQRWADEPPALMLLPESLGGQTLAGALVAQLNADIMYHVPWGVTFPPTVSRIQQALARDGLLRVPMLIIAHRGTFALFEGCYRREGHVVSMSAPPSSNRPAVWSRHTDRRAANHLCGHPLVVAALPSQIDNIRRQFHTLDPSPWFDATEHVDLGIKASLCVAVGVSRAVHLTRAHRGLDLLIAINDDPRAPIIHHASISLVGPQGFIVDRLHARWKEVSSVMRQSGIWDEAP